MALEDTMGATIELPGGYEQADRCVRRQAFNTFMPCAVQASAEVLCQGDGPLGLYSMGQKGGHADSCAHATACRLSALGVSHELREWLVSQRWSGKHDQASATKKVYDALRVVTSMQACNVHISVSASSCVPLRLRADNSP